jgi:phospholipid/cholesterol/gamma-HCH transport system ATP-binding protein
MAASSPEMIVVKDLRKQIGAQEILKGINLSVKTGETLVVLGRSGGGKSVMLKHLIGLHVPTSGEIFIEGTGIVGLNERQMGPIRKKLGVLFQDGALFDSMTVAQNVAFPLREAGVTDAVEIGTRVNEALEVVSLGGQGEKMPVNLSGGMRKRAALARAIITRPRCILYDEPTSGLDPVMSDSIDRLIRGLQERFSVTSVVVTHDMKSAYAIADRIAFLQEGRIYFNGTPDQLKASDDPLIQDFIHGRSKDVQCY